MTPITNDKWLSVEDALTLQRMMDIQETEFLRSIGLGWLVDFCSKPIDPLSDSKQT